MYTLLESITIENLHSCLKKIILVIKRSSAKEGNRPGKWYYPGGNVNATDLAIPEVRGIHMQSIKRELKEETGIENPARIIDNIWYSIGA